MGTAACGSSATIRSSSHHNVPTCRCRCSHFHEAFTTHRANKRGSSTSNNPHHDDAKKIAAQFCLRSWWVLVGLELLKLGLKSLRNL